MLECPLWAWKPLGSHLGEYNIPGHGHSQTPDCDTLGSCWSQKFVPTWSLWRAGHQASWSWPYRPASIISEEIQYSRLGRRGRNKRSKAKTRMDISVKEVWRKMLWIERAGKGISMVKKWGISNFVKLKLCSIVALFTFCRGQNKKIIY